MTHFQSNLNKKNDYSAMHLPEQIAPNWYRLRIPLPDTPLKELNAYVLTGRERNLIVDTGLNRQECLNAMQQGLQALEVDLQRTDLFITHLHADHIGLVAELATAGCTVFLNQPDAALIRAWTGFESMIKYAVFSGFPEDQLQEGLNRHPGFHFRPTELPELTEIRDRDILHYAGYELHCLSTPGHTPGHCCLYAPEPRFLLAGDHILGDITPNIQSWSEERNPLQAYLQSLEACKALDVALVLPGHREFVLDCSTRIQELERHHAQRLAEILDILAQASATPFEVASRMTWDFAANTWEDFPMAQKWFATGEANAHLRYLEALGRIERREQNTKLVFTRPW